MFLPVVTSRTASSTAIVAVLAAATASAASPPVVKPTRKQIRTAISEAKRSHGLWATVNICNTKRDPHQVGIRGQMPALGFPARLTMTIRLSYWSVKLSRFLPVPKVAVNLHLGMATTGFHQDGATFTFTPPVLLKGEITFRWYQGRHLLGQTTQDTKKGVKGVDQSDPRGYSAATCTMNIDAGPVKPAP
jgi:hypothetical protein